MTSEQELSKMFLQWAPTLATLLAAAAAWGGFQAKLETLVKDDAKRREEFSKELDRQREEHEKERKATEAHWQESMTRLERELTAQREASEKRGSETLARLDRILDKGEDNARRIMRAEDRITALDEKFSGLIEATRDTVEGAIRRIDGHDRVLHGQKEKP